jgi:hypothetical protein
MKYEKMIADEAKKIQREKDLSQMDGAEKRIANEVLSEVDKGAKYVPAK